MAATRALGVDRRPVPPRRPTGAAAFVPRSISERWASLVLKACQAEADPKTLGAWAACAGLSYSSLCERCRLAGIQPLAARDLARVLRAVTRSQGCSCRIEELLDISDRRTLKTLMARAGIAPAREISIAQFLDAQQFVPQTNPALNALRTLLLS